MKKYCFLGDSITEGVGVQLGERYHDIIAQKKGVQTFCYGVNGAISKDLLCQAKKMQEEIGNDIDGIFIFIGTNDFFTGCPLGDYYKETEEEYAANGADAKTAVIMNDLSEKQLRVLLQFCVRNA